ncbi:DUF2986 domain-containing protein [Photobacterium chitinilyticum]|uniref:DUF2986 domain-containing protein n=1 Tax=Photobacterium chitinilyticum TaxID=2485123 RepID=A0A444JWR5_9GAMM|nr:DUF2986 domain-containing protein [Photobacterium chitinilyticum]RWX57524.1 DUF2986 domain-containing protein [Photobacterium chitinilyticum]
MNRKKKINEALKKRQKKTSAKLHRSNKPRYISKADRAKMEAEAAQNQDAESQQEEHQRATEEGQQEPTGE